MTEQTAMLLTADVPELESGHVQTVAEPRAFPRRGVAVAASILGMTAAVAMWASGEHGGIMQGKVDGLVGEDEAAVDATGDATVAEALEAVASPDKDRAEKTFDAIDKDGDGSISVKELGDWLDSMGEDLPKEEIAGLIRSVDEGNGEVDFDEFASHPGTQGAVQYEMDMLETFGAFDKDENGKVGKGEIQEALEAWGKKISQKDIDDIVGLGDKDTPKDDHISYEEFKHLLHSEAFADKADKLQEILGQMEKPGKMHDKQFKKTFDIIDEDKDESITGKELGEWSSHLGHGKPTEEDIKGMIRELDKGDDKVSLEEFRSHPLSHDAMNAEMEVLEAFGSFDEDQDTLISRKELEKYLGKDIATTVAEEDKDGDGQLNYEEFRTAMLKSQREEEEKNEKEEELTPSSQD